MNKNNFMEDLKKNVKPSRLSFDEIEMIEDEIDKVEEFLNNENENISNEQQVKNIKLVETGFKKRINKILGYECNLRFSELQKIKNTINQYKEKYDFDEMSDEEKIDFEKNIVNILYGESDSINEEDIEVEKIDNIDNIEGRII